MKKLFNRINCFKKTGILLIAAIMIISSTAVATTPSIPSQSMEEERSDMGTFSNNNILVREGSNNADTPPEGRILGDILLYEGFEDGVMPPPGGWETIDGVHTDYHWEIIDAATEPGLVYSGDYAALVNYDYLHIQDEWLISPEVDLTGNLETVNLSFWANATYYGQTSTVYIYVDIGDGFNHVVWDMVDDEPDWYNNQMYREVDLDLSEFIGNVVRIKWHLDGQLYAPFALDDIFVYSKERELPEIKIGEITGGWAGFGKGAKVSAEIKNVGVGNASDVYWNISIIGNGVIRELNWSFNGTIPLLLVGGLEIVSTPEDAQIYGFGIINITVHAREPKYGSEDTKSVNGFLFFFFIIILGEDNSSSSCFKIRGC